MSLTTNKFFQLRNLSAEVKNENGDFRQQIKEPIKLEEGDSIIMNKAILDTRSVDSGKIVLANDTTFTVSFNQYKRFNNLDGAFEYREPASVTKLTATDINCDPYVFCSKVTNPLLIWRLEYIDIQSLSSVPVQHRNITLDIEYTAVDSTAKIAHIKFTYVAGFGWKSSLNLDILAVGDGDSAQVPSAVFRISKQTEEFITSIGGDWRSYEPVMKEDVSTSTCVPVKISHSIVIAGGAYDPDDIAERISAGMTELASGAQFTTYPVSLDNQLLGTTEDDSYVGPTGVANRIWINMFHDPQTADALTPENMMAYESDTSPTIAYFRGTSQFALEFEEDTQRFKFSFLHFPLYNSAGDIISKFVRFAGSAFEARLCSAEGGILLESLQSVDNVTNQELGIWKNAFGFNIHDLCPTPSNIPNATLVANIPRYVEEGSIGKYFTQGQSNVDVGVVKTQGIVVQQVIGLESIIGTVTEQILAKSNFGQINLKSGYFMIEINGLYNDGLITNTDLKNHIFGIVGRFYENENYTTGTESDALIYQHKGATQYLNSFAVRVLNSDFKLAEGLGLDNTIFIQHIKAVQPPQPQKK